MSVIIFRHNQESRWPLIMAANHDSDKNRVSLGVKILSSQPRVIGEQDAKHGGSWLALAQSGLAVGCVNTNPWQPHDVSRTSRGALVVTLAKKGSAREAADYLSGLPLKTVNGAFLLLADREQLYFCTVSDSAVSVTQITDNHWHVLGSLGLDSKADPKVARARYLIHATGMSDNSDYIGQLKPLLRDHAKPLTPQRGKLAVTDSICYHSNDYSTQSATILRVGQGDNVEYYGSGRALCQDNMTNYSQLLA